MEICCQKIKPVIILLAVVFSSCTTEKPPEVATVVKTYDTEKSGVTLDKKTSSQDESMAGDDSGGTPGTEVSLKFPGLTITTRFGEVSNEADYFDQVHTDTIVVQLGLGGDATGQTYVIKRDPSVQSIEIFQNYETSLTLMNEGPHLDLTDWKHYVSDWQKLDVSNNSFQTSVYSGEDQMEFPDVTPDEIVLAVKERLSNDQPEWMELVKKCKGANDYPCGVSISRINLKIVTTDADGVKKERLVIFEIPMGC